jgi:hypothetical protein
MQDGADNRSEPHEGLVLHALSAIEEFKALPLTPVRCQSPQTNARQVADRWIEA